MPPFTLVEELRRRDDDALAALLRFRPDLGVPPPADLTVLASRAGLRISVHRAAESLDTVALAVLTALVVADADLEPVALAELRRLLGPDLPEAALLAGLDALSVRALAWPTGDAGAISASGAGEVAVAAVPGLRDIAGAHPAGLGRPSAELTDETTVAALLADSEPDEQRVLSALSGASPIGRSSRDAGSAGPVARLVRRGLLRRIDADTVELPRQVGLALRGERPIGPVAVDPPALRSTSPGLDRIDGTAADAALLALRQVDAVLVQWSAEPPAILRSGGLGVRELRRLARDLGTDEHRVALLVEIMVYVGLVGDSGGNSPEWVPTTQADPWLIAPPEHRWAMLAGGWLELPRLPPLVGERDEADRPIAALSDALRRPSAPAERRRVLALLASLPTGDGLASVDELVARSAWQAPRRGGRLRDELVRWAVAEATALGVVALDGLGTAGRALLAESATSDETTGDGGTSGGGTSGRSTSGRGTSGAAAAMRVSLPPPVDHVLLQADLTAVAPGRLAPELAAELALLADIESAGGATVYRITEASLRRAMDAGRTAAELRDTLRTHSATPVPQALEYLLDDVARQHGRLRGGVAGAFLRAEDEALLTEVLAHPGSAPLQLRRIAPTVLVTPLGLAELMEGLSAAGFAPTAEDAGGAVVDLRPAGRRISARPRTPQPAAGYSAHLGSGYGMGFSAQDPNRIAALVARIRAGEAMAAVRPAGGRVAGGPNGTSATLALLRGAAAQRREVWIDYVDPTGLASEYLVEPVSIDGGVLEGFDRVDGDLRRFLLHRITSAALVD